MGDSLFWRLYYADGSTMDEAADNSSILLSRPSPAVLVITRAHLPVNGMQINHPGMREPVCKIELFVAPITTLWKPVFYRKRSIRVKTTSDEWNNNDISLDAVVFGRCIEQKNGRIDSNLWAICDGVNAIDCPQWAIDQAAIERLCTVKY